MKENTASPTSKIIDQMFLGVESHLRSSDQGYCDYQKGASKTSVAWQRRHEGGWLLYAAWGEAEVSLHSRAEDPSEALYELRRTVIGKLS